MVDSELPGGQREKGNWISYMIFKETFQESKACPVHYSQRTFLHYGKSSLITSFVLARSAR